MWVVVWWFSMLARSGSSRVCQTKLSLAATRLTDQHKLGLASCPSISAKRLRGTSSLPVQISGLAHAARPGGCARANGEMLRQTDSRGRALRPAGGWGPRGPRFTHAQ